MWSKKTQVGLLGAGYIADFHALALGRCRTTRLVAVCDTRRDRAEALARSHGVKRVYCDLEEMLAEGDIDSVHVLLPPNLHFEAARAIMQRDTDVLLEKPMCLRAADASALVDLAHAGHRQLGVNHNFLFLSAYERLRQHVHDGTLGPIDHVVVDWQYPLAQLQAGPFDQWMFQSPTNVLFEIGPHLAAFVIDLVGPVDVLEVCVGNPIDLPGGLRCYRRWQVRARRDQTSVDLNLSLVAGAANRCVTVRGRGGLARCDYERNVYMLDGPTKYSQVFDVFHATRGLGTGLRRQAWRNLTTQVISLGRRAPFGLSLCRSVAAFYPRQREQVEPRLAPETGRAVIELLERLAAAAELPQRPPKPAPAATPECAPDSASESVQKVLVLGGTGFIGRHLVRRLCDRGHRVRVMTRSASGSGADNVGGRVEIIEGHIAERDDLLRAMDGIDCVYHLARAYGETWDDYLRNDVHVTKLIGECCVAKKIKRLIYTGTIDSYYAGKRNGTITEATPLDPSIERRNDYARAKAAGESELIGLHKTENLPVVIARPGIVIGSGGSPFHWGVGMWPAENVCTLWGAGKNKLPLVLAEDVAAALAAVLEAKDVEGESFNLIGEPVLSAREYLAECSRLGGMKIRMVPTAIWKYYTMEMVKYLLKKITRRQGVRRPSFRDWASRQQLAEFDCHKAKERLGWHPTASRDQVVDKGIAVPMRQIME